MTRSDEELLLHIADVARRKFKLNVWQWLGYDMKQLASGHASTSLHYQWFPDHKHGRAFDAYSSMVQRYRMGRFVKWLKRYHAARLTELIYNGLTVKGSIKHGKTVSPAFWGSTTWAEHRNHVHVAI